MADPDRPRETPWLIKPLLIGVLNVAVVLVLVTAFDAWSVSTVIAVVVGIACGTWWLYGQRPRN